MKQIKILTTRTTARLEEKINLFFHEAKLKEWEIISMDFDTTPETFFYYEQNMVRILYEDSHNTSYEVSSKNGPS